MELSTFLLTILSMLIIANIIYGLILYPELKEIDENINKDL